MEIMLENTSYQTIGISDLQTKAGNGFIKNSVNSGFVSIYSFKLGCNLCTKIPKKEDLVSVKALISFLFS